MAARLKLYVGNANTIELEDLQNTATGVYYSGASVSCTIKTRADVEVSGETWPLNMAYVGGTNAMYRAVISSTADLTEGVVYKVQVTADAGEDLDGFWDEEVEALRRT